MVSVAITSIPSTGLGYTHYFSGVHLVAAVDSEMDGEELNTHTFNEAELSSIDHTSGVLAMVMLDDETAVREEIPLDSGFAELQILITEDGEIDMRPEWRSDT
ncbi:hypothetical protein C488_14170 [Natrinema pellirubrum DSM 15624]|nr:hypothetical protein C488_14170 [Natrinema pellirubrum DSM 15624]